MMPLSPPLDAMPPSRLRYAALLRHASAMYMLRHYAAVDTLRCHY